MQHLVERVGVEHQLQQRGEQFPHQAHDAAMRRENVGLFGGIRRGNHRRFARHCRAAVAELFEQIRAQVVGIEEFLEPHRGQLADFFFGVVGAPLLEDALADLLHDLLDVDRLGTNVELAHRHSPLIIVICAFCGLGRAGRRVPRSAGKLRRFLDAGTVNAQ